MSRPSWTLRAVVLPLVVVAYMTLWQPIRSHWGPDVALPLLQAVTEGSDTSSVSIRGRSVLVQFTIGADKAAPEALDRSPKNLTLPPPAGIQFLLPALFIVGFLPHRPTCAFFFLGHVGLSGVVLLTCAGGLLGLPLTPWIAGFTQEYLIDIYSLTVPILLFARHRWESASTPTEKAPDALQ